MRLSPLLVLPALLLTACSAGTPAAPEPAIEGLQTLAEDLSHEHVIGAVTYDRVPPVGGEHSANWLRCEIYDEPVPAEFAVHSMEHGGVWLTHRPDLPAEQVGRLAALRGLDATATEYVLVSPVEGLSAPVVAASWGVWLEVPAADDPRLEAFVRAYAGGAQGGEPGVPCTSAANALDPAQARALLAEQG